MLTFEDAIRKSIKSYFKDIKNTEMNKSNKNRTKFDKQYFDRVEEEQFGSATNWNSIKSGALK